MQGEDDQSFEVLPSTREKLGHVRDSYFHITVLLHRPTGGSEDGTARMGQTQGPAHLGCWWTVVNATSFTERFKNNRAIMRAKS